MAKNSDVYALTHPMGLCRLSSWKRTPLPWSKLGQHFTDEDKAREYMEFLRWGNDGPACPHCGGSEPYRLTPKAAARRGKAC
jgi:hypothetical protein